MKTAWGSRLLVALAGMAVGVGASAQVQTAVPPPKIEFGNWRKVSLEEDPLEYELSFPSAVQTPYPANNRVPISVFLPNDVKTPVPIVVILHYWGARDLRTERSFAQELVSQNVAAVIVTLPYHLQRTPPGFASGALALRPDPNRKDESIAEHLVATMTQSVLDVRRTVDWIETRPEFDKSRIGIVGISLGAIVASYSYGVDGRFGPSAFMLGGADLAHILWNSTIVVPERDTMRRQGLTEERLRSELAPIEPLNVLPGRQPNPAFVIGAKHDTIIPPEDTEKLIDALPGAKTLWLDTGHYGGIFVQKRLGRLVAQFFGSEFAGKPYTPPNGIYAPTIRIGALADTSQGFEIAVSLDVWRSGDRGQFFGAVMATPKGAQFFLGHRMDGGIAPGVFLGTEKVSFGVFWSIVL
jgi:dienelactone hydrolase